MAERGAYLTGTVYIRPTIFEILAQKSLASTLEPGFKKIFSFLISFNSGRYGHILKWEDEVYLLFNVLLQRYYLKKHSASFSETFYGLKRIVVDKKCKFNEKLLYRQEILSLVSLVTIPYLQNKFKQLSLKYQYEELDGCAPKGKWQNFFRQCFIKGHLIFFVLYKSLTVFNYILYAAEKSMFPTPLLRLLRITLTYTEPQPTRSILDISKKIIYNSFTVNDSWNILQECITRSLELSAFFLQFLSWWHQENYSMSIMNLPAPPPPKVPNIAIQYKGICPICRMPQHIHTALMVSGFVYCYQCILSEIRKNKKCPVTHYPATEDDLVRLYI